MFAAEVDATANDANLASESNPGFFGLGEGEQSITCDATIVVDTMSRIRSGSISGTVLFIPSMCKVLQVN